MHEVTVSIGGRAVTFADFRRLPVCCPYIAFMPQWDVLNFLSGKAAAYPGFRLLRSTEVTDLVTDGDRVTGIRATGPDGPLEVRADLVVAADGRHSTVRRQAGLTPESSSPPMDAFRAFPPLRRLLGRFVGLGLRPEHITP